MHARSAHRKAHPVAQHRTLAPHPARLVHIMRARELLAHGLQDVTGIVLQMSAFKFVFVCVFACDHFFVNEIRTNSSPIACEKFRRLFRSLVFCVSVCSHFFVHVMRANSLPMASKILLAQFLKCYFYRLFCFSGRHFVCV